jgi:hypothetical protein
VSKRKPPLTVDAVTVAAWAILEEQARRVADPRRRALRLASVRAARVEEGRREKRSSGRTTGEDRDREKRRRALIKNLGDLHPAAPARDLYQLPEAADIRAAMGLPRFSNLLSKESPRRNIHR